MSWHKVAFFDQHNLAHVYLGLGQLSGYVNDSVPAWYLDPGNHG
jgi:hypothetical protein